MMAGVQVAAQGRVLVVDDDEDIRRLIVTYLRLEGFDVEEAENGLEALEASRRLRPDLILMDVQMPQMSGTQALHELRKDFRTAFTPVVFITARALINDKVDHLLSGADDYIVKPFDPDELVARVRVVLRRSQQLRALNPITGLPGNTVITEEINARLRGGDKFACLYLDLDNFKPYNDAYGFGRGDQAIALLAHIILETLESESSCGHFAGHIGGDDFVILTEPQAAVRVAAKIVNRFEDACPDLYDEDDRERGWIEMPDRRGQVQRYPMVGVSIGIVMSGNRRFETAAKVAHVASEMKSVAKREPRSSYAVDRRIY